MVARLMRMALLATAVVVLALSGCALGKTSIRDRISMFIDDVNAGAYGSLYKHLHSDCAQRNAAKTATFWDATPFGSTHTPVSLSGMSYLSTSTGTFGDHDPLSAPITLVMKEEEADDWFILSISIGAPISFDLN